MIIKLPESRIPALECHLVAFGGIFYNRSNKSQVTHVLDRYPKGKQVTVFYDPNDPQTAVLEPKITDRTWTPLAFSVLFLLWGTLPIILFIIRTRAGVTH